MTTDKLVRKTFLTFFFCKMTKIINFLTNILVKKKKMCYNEVKLSVKEKVMLKNRLKELRARDGLNQTELAKLAGVSRQTISLLERDEYTPSVVIALKISQIFNEPVESVFRLEEDE
jgi:transcriptional regulator